MVGANGMNAHGRPPPLMQEAVEKVARDKFIIYTWTNFHMRDFLMNWILWLKSVRGFTSSEVA